MVGLPLSLSLRLQGDCSLPKRLPPRALRGSQEIFNTGMTVKNVHEVVNHSEAYVRGHVHTNGLENFWALLKRGLKGTYVCVEPFHLERYVDEQIFRYNNRATKDNPLNDADRFALAMSQVVGKRLTYDELTGKTAERPL
jgi:hypothetical protein